MRLKCYFERAISHCNVIIDYKCCLHYSNIVAKESGVVTITKSSLVFVNREQSASCMVDT